MNIQPLDELKTCRDDTHRGCKDTSEWRNHVQRTVSYVLLAPLFHNGMQITEEQSQTILHNLPGVINVIMEEDLDELLRAVALQAAICLGEAALRMPPTKQENKPRNGTTSSLYSSIRDVLIVGSSSHLISHLPKLTYLVAFEQTLADYARDIEKRPPLSPTQPAPARRMLDFCERLLLDSRLEVTDRDRLIIMLLEDETLWIKTLAVNVLRKLTVTESQVRNILAQLYRHTQANGLTSIYAIGPAFGFDR